MLKRNYRSGVLTLAILIAAVAYARALSAELAGLIEVKMGINSMSAADRTKLWKRVDEYASVDALQEFCGKKLNLQRRTWKAISPCIETPSLQKVTAIFRSKKAKYLKEWETLHGEPEKKKALCAQWKPKLTEYASIITKQIAEAQSMCNACFIC